METESESLLTHLADEEYADSVASVIRPPCSPTAFTITLVNLPETFTSVPKSCVTTHIHLKQLCEWPFTIKQKHIGRLYGRTKIYISSAAVEAVLFPTQAGNDGRKSSEKKLKPSFM